ncbi:LuxR C-terminal-related transcriptional regulator [Micromonospora sp. NPDC047812]|uniref:LuxR C-terminal-related transcriptional regulator n=1 Tax=Micromonospora sp. NPDC047812 TaxID=3155742 RepID=UPI003456FD27
MTGHPLPRTEFAALRRQLDDLHAGTGAAVALAGEPGIGKTTLISALAAQGRARTLTVVAATGRTGTGPPVVVGADPTLVLLDDAHLLDTAHRDQMQQLIELTTTAPVLLVLAYRDRQLSRGAAAVLSRAAARGQLTQHRLGPLDLGQTRELLGDRPDLTRLHAEGDGNPLYLQLLAAADTEAMTDAHLILLGELAELADRELRVAQAAAVLRTPGPADLLAAVAGLDVTETLSALDTLTDLDLMRPVQLLPRFAFRHDVVRRFVYAQIGPSQRLAAHRRVEAELLARGAPVTQRAHHIARALDTGRPEQLPVLIDAARSTMHDAPADALEWLEAALQLLPEGDDRWYEAQVLALRAQLLRGGRCDVQQLVHTLLPRVIRLPGRDFSSTMAVAVRVRRIQGRHAEASALIREGLAALHGTHPSTPSTAVAMHTELAALALDRLDQEAARLNAREAATIARQHGDRLGEAAAVAQTAMAHLLAADSDAADRAADIAADLVDTTPDSSVVTNLPALYLVGSTEEALHRFTEAHRHLSRGAEEARRTGQWFILPAILTSLGAVELQRGLLDRAGRTLEEAAELLEPEGASTAWAAVAALLALVRYWRDFDREAAAVIALGDQALALIRDQGPAEGAIVRCLLADLLIKVAEPERGRRLMLDALGGPEMPRIAPPNRSRWYEALSMAALRMGDKRDASRWVDLAQASVRNLSVSRQGFLMRARMRLYSARGETGPALAAAEQAVECFAGRGLDLDLCRTMAAAGTVLVDAGRTDDARAWLGRAAALAEQCGSARLVERVRRQQSRLVPDASTTGGDPLAVLTERERQIAELVSRGMTSVEVAHGLFLSVRTVDTHLGRIYRKLGVSNRASLARTVLRSHTTTPAGEPR